VTSKLDSIANIDAKLTEWVHSGYSLKRIAGALEKQGVKVADMTVHRRIRALGLSTQNAPIASKTGDGAWLSQYRDQIVGLADAGNTYAEIWDRLAAAHPTQPQFQRQRGRDAKTSALAAWVHAERKRSARRRRSSLLEPLPEARTPAPQSVVMQAPAGAAIVRAARTPANATAVGQVRPAPESLRSGDSSADAARDPSFSIEARRKETETMQQAHRAQQDAATTPEAKAAAAKLVERFKN